MLALSAVVAASGCARYQAQPLELEAHFQEWRRSSLAPELPAEDGQTQLDLSDGLSLAEGELLALSRHPQLRAVRLRAQGALAAADRAGRWDDPELALEVERILEDIDDPWSVGGRLAITIPLSGRGAATRRLHEAQADATLAEILAQEWALRVAIRRAWVAWSHQAARDHLLETHEAALGELLTSAERLHEGGAIDAVELRAVRLAHFEAHLDHVDAHAETELARLRVLGLLGLHPDCPLSLVAQRPQPPADPADDDLEALLAHPQLAAAVAAYAVSERQVALAIRRQYPDLRIGFGGGVDEGQTRLGLGLALLPLPVWNRNGADIASQRAERAAVGAETRGLLQDLTQRLAGARLRLAAAEGRAQELRSILLPMLADQERDLRRQAELGRLDIPLLVNWSSRAKELRLRELAAREAVTAAGLDLVAVLGPLDDALEPAPAEDQP